jgi:hypothetical protein
LAYFGSLGSDYEHFIFIVAASARPMIAGDSTSPAATAVDDFNSTRRLMDPLFMAPSPQILLFEACCSSLVRRVAHRAAADAQFNLLGKFYDQTEAARKSACRVDVASRLLRAGNRGAVPIFASGIFELLPAAFDHRR